MKRGHLYLIGFITISGIIISCSKEREPALNVQVQEVDGTPAVGAKVHAWPGNDPQYGTGSGIVNEADMDQWGTSDASGLASFQFSDGAVLDVDVIYIKSTTDTLGNITIDTLTASTVTKIESKRQRSKENEYFITIDVE